MIEAMVIAGLVAAPLGSAALFLPARRHRRADGFWRALWRLILSVAGSATLAAAAAGVLYLLKATQENLVIGSGAVALAGLVLAPGHQELVAAGAPVLVVVHLSLRGLPGVRA